MKTNAENDLHYIETLASMPHDPKTQTLLQNLIAARTALRVFGEHADTCRFIYEEGDSCTCGLWATQETIKQILEQYIREG